MAEARLEANYLPTAHLLCWLANSFRDKNASEIPLRKFLPKKKKYRDIGGAVDGWIATHAKGSRNGK